MDVPLAELIVRQRERRHWRHVFTEALGVMLVLASLVLIAGQAAPKDPAHRVVSGPGLPLYVAMGAVYLVGVLLMTYGYSRFDPRTTARRLPLFLVLSVLALTVLYLVALVGSSVGAAVGGNSTGGPPGESEEQRKINARADAETQPRQWNLACGLLDSGRLEDVLGQRPSRIKPARMIRGAAMATADTEPRGPHLWLRVQEGSEKMSRYVGRGGGTPVPGVGDRAFLVRSNLVASKGEWLIVLGLRGLVPETVGEPLYALAREIFGRLEEAEPVVPR